MWLLLTLLPLKPPLFGGRGGGSDSSILPVIGEMRKLRKIISWELWMKHRYFREKYSTNQPESVRNASVRVAVAEAVFNEWQAVELVELPYFVISRVSDKKWNTKKNRHSDGTSGWIAVDIEGMEMFANFGELNCFSVGDMMAKRGNDGCHHGLIVHLRWSGEE
jgi:hypothetical protein